MIRSVDGWIITDVSDKGKKVNAVCGSYSTAALRHIALLPEMSSFIHL